MPEVIFNDEVFEAREGETLLSLARREGAYVWFLCDGRGLCRTCECKVLHGEQDLSPPSKIECDSISEARRREGYRLACQAELSGTAQVEVVSVVEELRRQSMEVLIPTSAGEAFKNMGRLAGNLIESAQEYARSVTSTALHAVPRVLETPPSPSGIWRYVSDTGRMLRHFLVKKGA